MASAIARRFNEEGGGGSAAAASAAGAGSGARSATVKDGGSYRPLQAVDSPSASAEPPPLLGSEEGAGPNGEAGLAAAPPWKSPALGFLPAIVPLRAVCAVVVVQALVCVIATGVYCSARAAADAAELSRLRERGTALREEVDHLKEERGGLQAKLRKVESMERGNERLGKHPYETITGIQGHKLPEMYGTVREKTIWSFWYNPATCASSKNCTLPPHIQLCTETVETNRGGFDFRLLHLDEVEKYVNPTELPFRWRSLKVQLQKDALMNALLARYGGVAWDISMILFRPLDPLWDEMVARGASFRGYLYRLSGQPWRHPEVTAVWFLMSRREGIFSAAVRSQVIGMGDRADTGAYLDWYRALGDHTLLPVLSMYNYSLPKCFDDPTVPKHWKCPEHEQPPWYKGVTGPARTDTRLLLEDPRSGPQLPMAWLGMVTFQVSDTTIRTSQSDWADNGIGAPMHDTTCASMKQCWEDVFMARYRARKLYFVKFFDHGAALDRKSRADLLADTGSYFLNWLKLAGLPLESRSAA